MNNCRRRDKGQTHCRGSGSDLGLMNVKVKRGESLSSPMRSSKTPGKAGGTPEGHHFFGLEGLPQQLIARVPAAQAGDARRPHVSRQATAVSEGFGRSRSPLYKGTLSADATSPTSMVSFNNVVDLPCLASFGR